MSNSTQLKLIRTRFKQMQTQKLSKPTREKYWKQSLRYFKANPNKFNQFKAQHFIHWIENLNKPVNKSKNNRYILFIYFIDVFNSGIIKFIQFFIQLYINIP